MEHISLSMTILFTFFPLLAAFLGGYIVYRWKKDLHPWVSFSGGLLLGIALLDLFPEAIELARESGHEPVLVGWIAISAILFFHIVDRVFGVHAHHEQIHEHEHESPCENHAHQNTKLWVRSSGMILHRLFDGIAIGGGFLVDPSVGMFIAGAMTIHGFADGMSIVAVLKEVLRSRTRFLLGLLALAVVAPLLGSLLVLWLPVSSFFLTVVLSWLAGFFLFLTLAELLPEAHASSHGRWTGLFLTVLGVVLVGVVGH